MAQRQVAPRLLSIDVQEGRSNLGRVNNLVQDQAEEDMGLDHHILCCIHFGNYLQGACIRL